ncbi:MAG: hypothetical protein CL785_04110 [Chloroflexi bacterium]|nr:hypothetical protein [Chloroflexota bacterium]|tara:strand:+ start:9572 stop:9868 length:297 start_codon:yes stop_codon:yes gene_type:complete
MTTTPEQENCSHHWVIDTPKGPISTGHCKICDMSREFMNSIGEANWDKSPQSKTESSTLSGNISATPNENNSNDEDDSNKENDSNDQYDKIEDDEEEN